LGKDARDWQVILAQEDLKKTSIDKKDKTKLDKTKIVPIAYRLFDVRYSYYTGKSRGFHSMPRPELIKHLSQPNISLTTTRQLKVGDTWQQAFVSNLFVESCYVSNKTSETTHVFPLYRYDDDNKKDAQVKILDENGKKANFTKEFKDFILQHFVNYETNIQSIFNYIYAILHAPTYREKYIEFLKMDFPKIPFTDDLVLFEQLAVLGGELITAHLLQSGAWEDLPVGEPMELHSNEMIAARYQAPRTVEKDGKPYEQAGRLYYNEKQYFDNVLPEVWHFKIGGYQVLDKYLKDRKKRNIFNELPHIQRMIQSLAYTVDKMQEIDALVEDWI
jgi:predicted helicase